MRTPEKTSLSRATSFNKNNVQTLFKNYSLVSERHRFTPESIWNVDEIGCFTAQNLRKIIAATGVKQVGAMVSAECGQLVTLCCAITALRNTIPPMFVFPRVHYKDNFIKEAPTGTIGRAHPSGWMTSENFLEFLKHFVFYERSIREKKVLLLLNNHQSHISLDAIDYTRENGVVLLSFFPHCSHKLQPLGRTVYGPFKRYCNNAYNGWMKDNPGSTMTIYEIPEIVGKAFPRAMTPLSIQSGFRVSEIHAFDSDIFQDEEFLPSHITDRPMATTMHANAAKTVEETEKIPSTSNVNISVNIIPESIRPFKKASPRKRRAGIKKGKTRILTDTPEKIQIAAQARKKRKTMQKKKRLVTANDSDSSDSCSSHPMSSGEEDISDATTSDDEVYQDVTSPDSIKKGDFALIRYCGSKRKRHYIEKLLMCLMMET